LLEAALFEFFSINELSVDHFCNFFALPAISELGATLGWIQEHAVLLSFDLASTSLTGSKDCNRRARIFSENRMLVQSRNRRHAYGDEMSDRHGTRVAFTSNATPINTAAVFSEFLALRVLRWNCPVYWDRTLYNRLARVLRTRQPMRPLMVRAGRAVSR
jgi:hypothetical protein